jgi:hypothetical protein
VVLVPDPKTSEDPLVASITERVVQRRPLSTRALPATERSALGGDTTLDRGWILAARRMAALNAFAPYPSHLAFAVHKATIDWGATTSRRMPARPLRVSCADLALNHVQVGSGSISSIGIWRNGDAAGVPRLASRVDVNTHFALIAYRKQPSDYVTAGRRPNASGSRQPAWGSSATAYTRSFRQFARQRNFTVVEAAKALGSGGRAAG